MQPFAYWPGPFGQQVNLWDRFLIQKWNYRFFVTINKGNKFLPVK